MHNDISRDGHDDELPCWQRHCDDESVHRYSVRIIYQCDVTIASGSHIDDITIAKLLHLKTYREQLGMNGMIFVYLRLRERKIQLQMSSGILLCWISPEVELTSVMTDFPSSAIERICGVLNHLVSDVMINWHAQRARRNMPLISSALPNILCVMTVMACRWIIGKKKNMKKNIKKMMLWNLRK